MKNIVLITSVIKSQVPSIFDIDTRYSQTLKTISTVRNKIPNSMVILLEGSLNLDDNYLLKLKDLVDEYVYIDNSNYSKSSGEAILLYTYLTSSHFRNLELTDNDKILKISGRYWINDNFNIDFLSSDKIIIKYIDRCWSGNSVFNTTGYIIPKKYMSQFILGLKKYIDSGFKSIDIEHAFSSFDIISKTDIFSPEKIGISGFLGPTSDYVEN